MAVASGRLVRLVCVGGLALTGCAGGPPRDEPGSHRSEAALRLRAIPAPVQLVGMRAEAVDALLGRPELARNERRAQYRRYEIDGCAVDLYLYEDPSNGAPKVAWFEVRPVDMVLSLDSRACQWLEDRLGVPRAVERRAAEQRS